MRYVGYRKQEIIIVSDVKISDTEYQVLVLPEELSNLSAETLMLNYIVKNNKITPKVATKEGKKLKVAFVGNWKMRCGISTYAENLWPKVIEKIGDFKLFIEYNDLITGPINEIGDKIVATEKVVPCWKRGESLEKLIKEIKDFDPDIIWIQHEFGLWPNARYWLALMTQLSNYRIIVTMHSVFHHKDKTIVEAAIPEIVVHLDGAKQVLTNEKQIPGKVYVIPHGCFPVLDKQKLWNFYKSEKTIIQFGFLFKYKGWESSLQAIALLKQKHPDIFFTGLCSESPFNKIENNRYYNELLELVEKLEIQNNVALIRGFQSDETLNSYLRTNKLGIFPYVSSPGHEVWGVSGAARLAMSKNLPIITSYGNHFSDIPSIKANSYEDMAKQIDLLFNNKQLINEQLIKQEKYLEENSWENIAISYVNLFENAH